MTYFVTGATGFIGRHLVERLLERDGDIHVLVREGSAGQARRADRALGRRRPGQAGDRRPHASRCSASPSRPRGAAGTVDHFFHLAAIYDMGADETRNALLNVGGHAERGRPRQRRSRPAASTTCPRSPSPGVYEGIFTEDMFDEGQKLAHPYHRTKFESEKLVRERVHGRRGASTARRSSSATPRPARWTRSTGPTTSSRRSRRSAHALPEWFPLVGARVGLHEHRPGRLRRRGDRPHRPPGRARRAGVPPRRPARASASGEVLNTFARAGHAPQTVMRIDKRLTRHAAEGRPRLRDAAAGAQGRPRAPCSPTSGSPTRSSSTSRSSRRFDARDTKRALAGSGIEVPPLETYADEAVGLLGAQPRPGPVQGPLVRGRGQRQDAW